MTFYLHVLDEAARTLLCSPIANLRLFIEDASDDDGMDTSLDVILDSLLHSNVELIKQIQTPHSKLGFLNLEGDERKRHLDAVKAMANTLLQSRDNEGWAPLEEDILRINILESFGGNSDDGSSFSGMESALPRHLETIKVWVQPGKKIRNDGSRPETYAVPLVRAFCAFTGGLGEALADCLTHSTPLRNQWLLPPGAITCAEYAIRAAARCITWNFSNSACFVADWRSTHWSMLVPIVLDAAWRLETGLVRYAQSRAGHKAFTPVDNKVELIRTECPEVFSLFLACNRSAGVILEKLISLKSVRDIDLTLEEDCSKWVKDLLSRRTTNNDRMLPPFNR